MAPHPHDSRRSAVAVVALLVALAVGCAEDVTIDVGVPYGDQPGQTLDVYLPDDDDTDRAAVVLVHGGGWESGSSGDLAPNARAMAEQGIVAVSVGYRLPPPGERWTTQLDDVRQAVRWVQEQADELGIDPARVGVYGSSAGGNLAMMVGVLGTGSDDLPPVKAVASWSGLSDLTSLTPPDGVPNPADPPPGCGDVGDECIGVLLPETMVDYLGCTPEQCPDTYVEASPVTHVDDETPPMFLAAAEVDFVPYAQVELMEAALEEEGIDVQAVEVPGSGHAESLRGDLLARTIVFFNRLL